MVSTLPCSRAPDAARPALPPACRSCVSALMALLSCDSRSCSCAAARSSQVNSWCCSCSFNTGLPAPPPCCCSGRCRLWSCWALLPCRMATRTGSYTWLTSGLAARWAPPCIVLAWPLAACMQRPALLTKHVRMHTCNTTCDACACLAGATEGTAWRLAARVSARSPHRPAGPARGDQQPTATSVLLAAGCRARPGRHQQQQQRQRQAGWQQRTGPGACCRLQCTQCAVVASSSRAQGAPGGRAGSFHAVVLLACSEPACGRVARVVHDSNAQPRPAPAAWRPCSRAHQHPERGVGLARAQHWQQHSRSVSVSNSRHAAGSVASCGAASRVGSGDARRPILGTPRPRSITTAWRCC